MHFEKFAGVGNRANQSGHVVGLVRLLRDEPVEVPASRGGLAALAPGRVVDVVRRQKGEELADPEEHSRVVGADEVRDPRHGRVGPRAAQVFLRNLFVGHRLDDVGPRDEEVRVLLGHEDEVGDRRRVDGAARAGTEDRGDLRHDSGRARVAEKNARVSREGDDTLLDARSARVVQADDRGAVLDGEVHDLADLLGVGLRERSAENGEVLGEHEDAPPVDGARSGDDTVAGHARLLHPEVARAVLDERSEFEERAGIEQELDPLPRRELSLGVLARGAVRAAPLATARAKGLEVGDALFDGHERSLQLSAVSCQLRGPSES